MDETYQQPEHGWTCYHCGETFKKPGLAKLHFGGTMGALTGCQIKFGEEMGLLMQLREAERLLEAWRNEDTELHREIARIQSEHRRALQREEEKGYERGLKDGNTTRQQTARDLTKCLVCLESASEVCHDHEMPLPMCDYHAERHRELAHEGSQ